MNAETNTDLAARYAVAVESERVAWQAFQATSPGSEARIGAWSDWMGAIAATNRAWRQLSCETLSRPGAPTDMRARHHRLAGNVPHQR